MTSMLPPTLHAAALACAALAAACWLLSVVTRNYSWVDRLWSIAPPLYVGWFAAQAGFADARLDLMTALSALWGARLTYNFARKGGYSCPGHSEGVGEIAGSGWSGFRRMRCGSLRSPLHRH